MKKNLYTLIIALAATLLAACTGEPIAPPAEDQGQLTTLNISTRAEGKQAYTSGEITLAINVDGEEHTLPFTCNDGQTWKYTSTLPYLPLTHGKEYPAYAYGWLGVPSGTDNEPIYASWAGIIAPVVADGKAAVSIELIPAVARFKVTLKGSYGEKTKDLPVFLVTPQVYMYEREAGFAAWNIPSDPYTTRRTLQIGSDMPGSNTHQGVYISEPNYPAGQEIKAGEPLFRISNTDPLTPATSPYYYKTYYVSSPTDLTLVGGSVYNYTITLTGGGQAVIESVTIEEFEKLEEKEVSTEP